MRFELAKALIGDPQALILDEPLAPLDINTQQLFLQDLRDLASSRHKPLPIMLSSQHIFEVESVADHLLFLDDGRPVFNDRLEVLHETREETTCEFDRVVPRLQLRSGLDQLGLIDIEDTGLSYIASFPRAVTTTEVLRTLVSLGAGVSYFRDISGSTRKLFSRREVNR